MNDWSGGAFDTSRDRLLVWGGGHGGYAGNELYAFDLNTLAWSRLTEPSDPPGVDVPTAPDGRPTSRHTYNYLQYLPTIDSFCSLGGSGFYLSGQTGTQRTDCFNFSSGKWERLADSVAQGSYIGALSAVDSATGDVWVHPSLGYSTLAQLSPASDTWTSHGGMWTEQITVSGYQTAAIDPGRHRLVAVGSGAVSAWDLGGSGDIAGVSLTTSGDQSVVQAPFPGLAWDPTLDRFVGWAGGTAVVALDPASLAWTSVLAAASNTATPTSPNANGTSGRFRYSPARNVYVLVNSVNENVFLYRLSDGSGTPLPSVQLSASPTRVASGGTSALTWSSTQASQCQASGGWSGARATSGQESLGPLTATTTFVLVCAGPGGTGGASATVEVGGGDAGAQAPDAGGEDAGQVQADARIPPPDGGANADAAPPDAGASTPDGAAAADDGGAASSPFSSSCGCGSGAGAAASWLPLALFAAWGLRRAHPPGGRPRRRVGGGTGRPGFLRG